VKHSSATAMMLTGVLLPMMLIGCAAVRRNQAAETTALLTQAGFKLIKADTPERMAKLNALTPYKVIPWKRKSGGTVYAYADPDPCQCVFVGSRKQYDAFLELLSAEQTAQLKAIEAEESEPQEFSESTIEEGGG